jgi:hypothetical protein
MQTNALIPVRELGRFYRWLADQQRHCHGTHQRMCSRCYTSRFSVIQSSRKPCLSEGEGLSALVNHD